MKYPFEATTRDGAKVTITGYYTGYKSPWCGLIKVNVEGVPQTFAMNWSDSGSCAWNQSSKQGGLDLIDLPQQT